MDNTTYDQLIRDRLLSPTQKFYDELVDGYLAREQAQAKLAQNIKEAIEASKQQR